MFYKLFQVTVGGNMKYKIGQLKYAGEPDGAAFSNKMIIWVAVAAVLVIVGLVACLLVFRQKSNQNSRVLKSMQEQMDILELRVAAECKEGEYKRQFHLFS